METASKAFQTSNPPLFLCRYQPGTLNSSSQTEKLVEMVEGEKVAVGGGDGCDEMDNEPLEEKFTFKLLFSPSRNSPTQTSGTIVYVTTAIICKCSWRRLNNR